MLKPFNPILGETFQARIGGYKVVAEQTSHHPPITHFEMYSKKDGAVFRVHGYQEYRAQTGANSAVGYAYGPTYFEFADGHVIEMWAPKCEIAGLMMGERTFNWIDSIILKDRKNNLYAEVVCMIDRKTGLKKLFSSSSGSKPLDYFEGVISH